MPLTPNDTATLLARTKGAPASILLAMLCLGKPLSRKDLITLTPYSPPTIDRAMDTLDTLGLTQRHAGGQWMLTVQGRQFFLGETGLVLEETVENALPAPDDSCQDASTNVKSFYIPHVHVSNVNIPPKHEEKTLLTDMKPDEEENFTEEKIITFDEHAEAAVQLLLDAGRYERTKNGKGARDSVEIALAAGRTGEECYEHIKNCLRYAHSKAGQKITDPGGWTAYTLREGHPAPPWKNPEVGDADYWEWYNNPKRYLQGPYAHLIKH